LHSCSLLAHLGAMLLLRVLLTAVLVAYTFWYGPWFSSEDDATAAAAKADLSARVSRLLRAREADPVANGVDGVYVESVDALPSGKGIAGMLRAAVSPAAAHPIHSVVSSADPRERVLVLRDVQGSCSTACALDTAIKYNCATDNGTATLIDCGCGSQVQGYINYFEFQACTTKGFEWLGFIGSVLWLAFLLYLLGDTADVFFCPTLDVIVLVLNLSPNVAGVTFLSFGNGAPDVFASLAATLGGNPDVGVSAILGAGVFVTTVVTGAVSMVSDAKVDRRPFLRDVGFYIAATVYLLFAFLDQKVSIYEAVGFLVFYAVFAAVVVVGRSIYQKWKQAQRDKEASDTSALAVAAKPLLPPPPSAVTGSVQASDSRRPSGISLPQVASSESSVVSPAHHPLSSAIMAARVPPPIADEPELPETSRADASRALSFDWFFAETGKTRLLHLANAERDSPSDKAELPESEPRPVGAAPSADPTVRKTSSRRDLGSATARHVAASKQRRSMLPVPDSAVILESASSSRRLSDGEVRHRVQTHTGETAWFDPVHLPPDSFTAHQRHTRALLRAIGYGEAAPGQPEAVTRLSSLQRHHHHHGEGKAPSAGSGSSEEEEPGMCDTCCGSHTVLGKILFWVFLPSTVVRQLSTPLVGEEDYDWRLVAISPILGIPLVVSTAFNSIGNSGGAIDAFDGSGPSGMNPIVIGFLVGLVLAALSAYTLPREEPPRGVVRVLWVLFGFLTSVSWIIAIANEIVTLLVALGFALHVSAEILGLTVLAWGNSLGDFVADVSVARAGTPKMAIAACFAGPLFNLLLGLGMSLTVQALREPDHVVDMLNPSGYDALTCRQSSIVFCCFVFLLISLVSSFIVVPLNGFRIKPWYGGLLIALYAVYLTFCFVFQFTDLHFPCPETQNA
jgi:Ca2+/Na+ antiporter